MQLDHIKEYLVLSETLNFSLSAERLFISQSTLSRHVQAMEKELGFSLVATSSHGVELTKAGALAVPAFRKMLNEYERYVNQCKNLARQIAGTLKIGLLYYAMDDYFSDFIEYIMRKYPNVEFLFSSYQPQGLYEDLCNGKLDMASLLCGNPKKYPDMRFQKIGDSKLIAMIRADHALSNADTVTLQDLSFSKLIELKRDAFSNDLTRFILEKNKIYFSEVLKTDNIETVPITIRQTNGIHLTGESCRRQNAESICYKDISGTNVSVAFGLMALRSNENPLVDMIFDDASVFFENKAK